jgi:hypothetical protein
MGHFSIFRSGGRGSNHPGRCDFQRSHQCLRKRSPMAVGIAHPLGALEKNRVCELSFYLKAANGTNGRGTTLW